MILKLGITRPQKTNIKKKKLFRDEHSMASSNLTPYCTRR